MFFKKGERKKHSAACILAVGMLATVGALSITRKGKQIIKNVKCKMKSMFGGCDTASLGDSSEE